MYLAENGLFGVQGIEADSDTVGNVENLVLGEDFVLIKPRNRHRGGAPLPGAAAMTAELIPPGAAEFVGKFHEFRYSVFRLETLQSYSNSGEDADFEAFVSGPGLRGAAAPCTDTDRAAGVLRRVRRRIRAGLRC
ncbi:MAG: DUF6879 family protein [Pseudonocardiaceae bacterium]